MKIEAPIWQMKITCPCCGQGSPIFVSCQMCGYLTVHWDEMCDTFKDPRDLNKEFIDTCPTRKTDTNNFLPASSAQILDAGFAKDNYE